MLRYLHASELNRFPTLRQSMFQDRADQFKTRLGWDVRVNAAGEERDEYDDMNPLYVIWERPDGKHGGSMRFLPTTGRTMVNDHFSHLSDGVHVVSPFIWECTRFCLSRDAERRVAAGLVLGAGELMAAFHLDHYIGVFDPRMERIYSLYGVQPDVIGAKGEGRDRIAVGLWEMQDAAWGRILSKVGITRDQSLQWVERSFGQRTRPRMAEIA